MLKLKLQYFGHLMQRAYSLEKTLMLGKIEGRRRRGQWRMRWYATPWTVAHQALPSIGFSRQEYWSGVPLPSPDYYMAVFIFEIAATSSNLY